MKRMYLLDGDCFVCSNGFRMTMKPVYKASCERGNESVEVGSPLWKSTTLLTSERAGSMP